MKRCLIIDDQPSAIDLLTDYVERTPELLLEHSFTDAEEAIKYLMQRKGLIDLIFLDIQMDTMTGLEFLSKLDEEIPYATLPHVIFTTGYLNYAVDGYRYERVVDFLHKPIMFRDFQESVNRYQEQATEKPQSLILKQRKRKVKFAFDNIFCIEGEKNYVVITTNDNKDERFYMSISELERMLPDDAFIRIHKSYIVPRGRINILEGSHLRLSDSKLRFPVGITYKESVQKAFSQR